MRVTFHTAYGGIEYVNIAAEQAARARQQVQSGKRLEKPSDDPAAMQRAVENRGEMRTIETYSRTSDSAMAKLTTLDTVLTGIVDKLQQATVAVASVKGSIATQQSRDAAALTLEGLRDALAADLNTTVRGTYVFGGSQTTTAPYAKVGATWTYQGDNTPVSVQIGAGRSVEIALDGQALAQGTDPTNVLDELEALIVAVRAGDNVAMGTGLTALGQAFSRATRTQSQIGVDEQSIVEGQVQLTASRLAVLTQVSKDEDADLATAISEMNRADIAYKAALGAVGTASRTSLLDYLG
ncbi:MAG TPA: flagellin [Vicinamibacterales bacterium]|nr:flagellin [Vicinamibacterales bacterium]